ncbi:Retrovirus-related Pol polyprotein from transposon RE1 [Vitis vinifera]|uniref:Retrovirus-related Pol polyprotein from transposon RE1 n=1 Tax=Vitis vinifera TaxID=29760 RepID=A0A438H2I9_VITVI|nr:Retrovirus-related Pol polyprotein from transposon RE1 [Vitis vinifera]
MENQPSTTQPNIRSECMYLGRDSAESTSSDDLNVPIAFRKGARICTKHLIAKHVSYHRLSPTMRAFPTNLFSVEIPKDIHEGLAILEWKQVLEEMRALENNGTCDDKLAILIVYVYDIILTGDNLAELERWKNFLAKEFEIKDLGTLRYFLGMEFASSKEGLLKESKYVDQGRYEKLVRKLIYLSLTRPSIAYSVSVVSQFMHSPNEEHLEIEAYTNVDWVGSITDRMSTLGYFSFVGGNLVTYYKKQFVIVRSSVEIEFRAVAHGICELWLKKLLENLRIPSKKPIKLYYVNKTTINIAHNPVQHDRTKLVEVDHHFIKEKLEVGLICMP